MEITLPELSAFAGNQKNLYEAAIFLRDSTQRGSYNLMWEDVTTKLMIGLRFERTERGQGDYYRDPYPLFGTLFSPDVSNLPHIKFPITPEIQTSLLNQIEKHLASFRINFDCIHDN